ncbi:hypothetical protein J0H58_09645 [bacterium]|nr:hypothetical protein [bacterium]
MYDLLSSDAPLDHNSDRWHEQLRRLKYVLYRGLMLEPGGCSAWVPEFSASFEPIYQIQLRVVAAANAAERGDREGKDILPAPAPPQGRYAKVRTFATEWKIKGDELLVLQALWDNDGGVRLVDFGQVEGLDWGGDLEHNAKKFAGVMRRIQEQKADGKLTAKSKAWKRTGWRLGRFDNKAVLELVKQSSTSRT